ncbi:hypothetical protein L798_01039 [Zootermopsis nevadensis]|uniref:Uncharacterized protein n=1 Tax=Zootermopsis nevadensis TaxID=136037 RepID=A0A067QVL7_ZOONE|nr:hypothetical protein L798_01039 [Zootermopsis nevadensis]
MYYQFIFLEGLRKTTKNLSHQIRSPGRALNPEPPEYEAGSTVSVREVVLCEQEPRQIPRQHKLHHKKAMTNPYNEVKKLCRVQPRANTRPHRLIQRCLCYVDEVRDPQQR